MPGLLAEARQSQPRIVSWTAADPAVDRLHDIIGGVADLIVVTGPPGAGKTAVARALSSMFEPSALVAGDAFFAFIDEGYLPPWTSEAHRQNEIVIDAAAAG
jgi:SpoVK/Ycf46/Vps4 family AAA+-type ATPase